MTKWAAPAHKSACRMLGYVLTLDTPDAWHGLALVLRARLTRNQRAALAYAALRSLTEDEARLTVEAVNAGRNRQQVAA